MRYRQRQGNVENVPPSLRDERHAEFDIMRIGFVNCAICRNLNCIGGKLCIWRGCRAVRDNRDVRAACAKQTVLRAGHREAVAMCGEPWWPLKLADGALALSLTFVWLGDTRVRFDGTGGFSQGRPWSRRAGRERP
jgi:hypothetical protein